MRHISDLLHQLFIRIAGHIPSPQQKLSTDAVISMAKQTYQCTFTASGSSYNAKHLSFSKREADIGQGLFSSSFIGKGYPLRFQRTGCISHHIIAGMAPFIAFNSQNLFQSSRRCHGSCQKKDQIRQFDELHQNLRHVIYQGNRLTLRQSSGIDGSSANPEHPCNSKVYDCIGHRV